VWWQAVDKAVDRAEAWARWSKIKALEGRSRWSNIGLAVIDTLEKHEGAARGISWDTFTDTVLEGDWVLQSPPREIWDKGNGHNDSVELLHQRLRCSGSTAWTQVDVMCYPDFKLRKCNLAKWPDLSDACPHGGQCRPFSSTVTRPGMKPVHLCAAPSDAILDRFYDVIANAKEYVDIVSLEMPDGRFLAAIRNAITYLQNSRLADPSLPLVQVRLLFGHLLGESLLDLPIATLTAISNLRSTTTLDIMLRDILPGFDAYVNKKSHLIRVVAGTLRWWPDSWNHVKIVAADGKRMIQGGINFWTRDYLDHDPVFDLSMELSGHVAVGAHHFVDSLWDSICDGIAHPNDLGFAGGFSYFPYSVSKPIKTFEREKLEDGWFSGGRKDLEVLPSQAMSTWERFEAPAKSKTVKNKGLSSISVGRMGSLGSNSADIALTALLQSAEKNIKISAQDFGPAVSLLGWRYDHIDAICYAMANGAEVQVMLSKPDFVPARTGAWRTYIRVGTSILKSAYDSKGVSELKSTMHAYGMGYTKDDVIEQFALRLDHIGAPPEVINKLKMYYLLEGLVPEGWGNHAKLIIVDDKAFALGSQNLYACNLQEYSVIVDDKSATKQLLKSYWWPLWGRSKTLSAHAHAGNETHQEDASNASTQRKYDLCTEGRQIHRTRGKSCHGTYMDDADIGCGVLSEEFCYETDPTARCCCKEGGVKVEYTWTFGKHKTATGWC
jgi:phosphatidylserine/phosphatidylglycerophosphate/cardiolipin synthase-like enzyme